MAFLTIWGAIIIGVVLAIRHHRQENGTSVPADPEAMVVSMTKATRDKAKPGFIYALGDATRPELVKVVGTPKMLTTPLDKLYLIQALDYEKELQRVYDDLRNVRVAANWYNRDATEMYFEHRMGAA
jgi:hypothetical protein